MKKFFLLVSFVLMAFSAQLVAQTDWTIMVYLVGSDLERKWNLGTTDMGEMLAGASNTSNVNVIVFAGGANKDGWTTPKTYKIENGQQNEISFTPSDNDMANPATATEFINFGTQNYPSNKQMVVFWNHGGGLSGYGWDEVSGGHLSVPQVKQSLANTNWVQNGNKFDIIGFDACLMATLEVMYNIKDYGDYMLASEETEPGHGWGYTPIIESMQAGGSAINVLQSAIDGYFMQSNKKHMTLSAVDLEEVSNLGAELEAFFSFVMNDNRTSTIQRAVSAAEEYGKSSSNPTRSSDLVDLGDLMSKVISIDFLLSGQAQTVLNQINNTAIIHRSNSARPNSSGIAIYMPHNVLSDPSYLNNRLQTIYDPLDLPLLWDFFVTSDYVPFVTADNTPPGFQFSEYPDRSSNNDFSSLTITHQEDLEHVHILLDEEFEDIPDLYVVLGSTIPDSVAYLNDTTETYFYFWDDHWLGINGYPAYVADIHDFFVEDSLGNLTHFDRIHIPAVINWDTEDEQLVSLQYLFDDEFNVTLEGIIPERIETSSGLLVTKEVVEIEPGDIVDLVYEVFDATTGEEFFVLGPIENTITIENGEEDLHLEDVLLEEGSYHIGYALLDHSHNDTIIWDPQVFEVVANDVEAPLVDTEIKVFPNPSNAGFTIQLDDKYYGETFTLVLSNLVGEAVLTQELNNINAYIDTRNIPNGVYTYTLVSDKQQVYANKIVIQH